MIILLIKNQIKFKFVNKEYYAELCYTILFIWFDLLNWSYCREKNKNKNI